MPLGKKWIKLVSAPAQTGASTDARQRPRTQAPPRLSRRTRKAHAALRSSTGAADLSPPAPAAAVNATSSASRAAVGNILPAMSTGVVRKGDAVSKRRAITPAVLMWC